MENRNRNLLKNSVVFMVGNFSSKLLMFFLLPLYTNYLDPAEYGQVDIYINIMAVLYCFVSLQAIESVFRFIQDAATEDQKQTVITNSLITAVAGTAVFALVMGIFSALTGFEYALIFILYVTTQILAQFCQQTIRGLNKSVLYSAVGIISTVVQVGFNVLFIVICHIGADALLWSHVLTFVVIIGIILWRCNLIRYIKLKKISWTVMKEQLRYSLPLMPNALCLWGIGSLGRYLLLFFYSTAEVGLFAFATKFSQLLGVVNSIFFMAWQQSAISEYLSKDRDAFATSIFNKFARFQLCAIAVILPLVKLLTFTIMGDDYRQAWMYVPIFFAGVMFNGYANFVSMGFFGAKKTSTVFVASFVAIGLYFVIGYFGAKHYYIWGVGGAYAVSQFAYYLIMHIRVRKYMNIRLSYSAVAVPLLMVVASCVCYYWIADKWFQLIPAAVLVLMSLYLNQALIKKIIGTLLPKLKK